MPHCLHPAVCPRPLPLFCCFFPVRNRNTPTQIHTHPTIDAFTFITEKKRNVVRLIYKDVFKQSMNIWSVFASRCTNITVWVATFQYSTHWAPNAITHYRIPLIFIFSPCFHFSACFLRTGWLGGVLLQYKHKFNITVISIISNISKMAYYSLL